MYVVVALYSLHVLKFADSDGTRQYRKSPNTQSNHAFSIPVPAGLPPSIVADRSKNTGIVYHLCATLLAKPKSKISIFSGPPAKLPVAITQSAEILIEKHELNSTWPVYSWQAEEEALIHERANVEVRLRRDSVMYGSGDPVQFVLDFHNKRATATKVSFYISPSMDDNR